MTSFMLRHILESTLFCVLLSSLGYCFRRAANVRHAIWLVGISKFAIPSVLLASTGARLAFLWPATPWLSSALNRVSAAFTDIEGLLPFGMSHIDTAAPRLLALVWILGSTLMLGLWLIRLRNAHHQLGLPAGWEQEAMTRARRLLPVRLPVRLRISGTAIEPALWGIWRPIITIPSGLSQKLTSSEFEAVLLHELAHARRLDNLAAVFVHCLVCAFWFHPLLWLVERRLNVERERACDELVIASGTAPEVYVAGILKVCRFHVFGTAAGVSAMTASDLNRRLQFILESELSKSLLYVPRLLIAALAILMTVVPIAGGYCGQCASNGQQVTPVEPVRSDLTHYCSN